MIKNNWYAIALVYQIKAKPFKIKRFSMNLVLWRTGSGQLACLEDRCPHRGTALSMGRVVSDCIECPYHGFKFQPDGQCSQIPLNKAGIKISRAFKANQFSVIEREGRVWFWWGNKEPDFSAFSWFDYLAPAEYDFVEIAQDTPVSFCRAMEANLDFGHFYFVHKIFRMPGMGPIADPFECTVDGKEIRVSGAFRHEEGSVRQKKGVTFSASILFPSLASYDAPGVKERKDRTVVSVVPVDEDCSWFVLRIYFKRTVFQSLTRFYWKYIFLKLIFPIIQKQDLRVIQEQTPKKWGAEMDCLVTSADKGIVQYHRMFRAALNQDKKDSVMKDTVAPRIMEEPVVPMALNSEQASF